MDNEIQQQNTDILSNKKSLIKKISIGIIILIIIGVGVFFIINKFNKKEPGAETSAFPSVGEIIDKITGNESEVSTTTPVQIGDNIRFGKIYSGPVAGFIIRENGSTVRLFDRAKGLLIDVNLISGEQKTVSDQPLLKVHDVTFISDSSFITRSYENNSIKSFLYDYNQTNESGIISQSDRPLFLSDDIVELSKSENNKYVVFVTKSVNGSSIDILDTETVKIKRVTNLPISEWIPSVTNTGEIYISSKASKYANSGTYKIVGDKINISIPAQKGETSSIAPNGNVAMYIPVFDKDFNPNIIKLSEEPDYTVDESETSLRTIAEKCSWNSLSTIIFCGVPKEVGDNTPDDWYLGKVKYNDKIWQHDAVSGESTYLFDPESFGFNIHAVSLSVSGKNLIFKDRVSENLFAYRLNEDVDTEKDYSNTEDIDEDNVENNIEQ